MVEMMLKEVSCSFDDAVKRVENACAAEDFSMLLKKDLDSVFREKLGVMDYPRYTMILACAASLAKMALDVSKKIGTLFPCSFVVYEEDDKVFVVHTSIMKAAIEIGHVPGDRMIQVLEETGRRVGAVWNRI